MNKNEKSTTLDTKRFDEILKSKTSAKNILNNETLTLKNGLTISPKSTVIFDVF